MWLKNYLRGRSHGAFSANPDVEVELSRGFNTTALLNQIRDYKAKFLTLGTRAELLLARG